MALQIMYVGQRNSIYNLDPTALTQVNFVPGTTKNNTLSVNTPKGVLGGSVAGLYASLHTGKADNTHPPLGLFINDAVGQPFESSSGLGSDKGPFVFCMGEYKVNVYETRQVDDAQDIVYALGDVLYASAAGLLTKETDASNIPVAILTGLPGADLWMQVKLVI